MRIMIPQIMNLVSRLSSHISNCRAQLQLIKTTWNLPAQYNEQTLTQRIGHFVNMNYGMYEQEEWVPFKIKNKILLTSLAWRWLQCDQLTKPTWLTPGRTGRVVRVLQVHSTWVSRKMHQNAPFACEKSHIFWGPDPTPLGRGHPTSPPLRGRTLASFRRSIVAPFLPPHQCWKQIDSTGGYMWVPQPSFMFNSLF